MAIEIILDTACRCSLRAMRTISATLNLFDSTIDHTLRSQEAVDVPGDDSGLVFVFSQAHDRKCFSDGDEGREIYEAGNETCDQCRDERLTTTTTNDEIGFLGAAQRWRDTPRVALKDGKIIGGLGKPKIAFKTTSHAVQVSSDLKRGRQPKSLGLFIASTMLIEFAMNEKKPVGKIPKSLSAL